MTRAERAAAMRTKRNAAVLAAALQEAELRGADGMTRDAIASRAGVAQGCVNAAYGTLASLREAVMRHAVAAAILPIVARGLAIGDPIARSAPPDLQAEALKTLS